MSVQYTRNLVGRLANESSGNVAIIAALAVIPLISVAGLALDLQMTTTKKNKVQHVIDSAILAGSRAMQAGKTQAEIIKDVNDYVAALTANQGGGMTCGPVSLTFTEDSQDLEAGILCSQDTSLSQIMGKDKMDFYVSSVSTYGIGKVDVAFIFDVSGSMNSNSRLTNLKESAKIAFDELLPDDANLDGTVRIALTSYNHSVNVGEDYFRKVVRTRKFGPDDNNNRATNRYNNSKHHRLIENEAGPDFGKRFFYYEQGECTESNSYNCYKSWADYDWTFTRHHMSGDEPTCVYERQGDHAYTDERAKNDNVTAVVAGSPFWIEDFNEVPGYSSYVSYTNKYKRNGQDEIENGGANNWSDGAFLGYPDDCQTAELMPLTENKQKLKDYVDDLQAGGGTAGHLGMQWGWYLISPEWNSLWATKSEGWDYEEEDMAKAVIMMTDGEFNHSHPTNPESSIQIAMQTCDAMKAEPYNIQIYTVGFQVPSSVKKTPDGRTILEYCASSSSHSFSANNGQQLSQAYQAIAQSISDLRITQ